MLSKDCPPSILQISPVAKEETSEARKHANFAISIGSPNLLRGTSSLRKFFTLLEFSFIFLSQTEPSKIIFPGAIPFILTQISQKVLHST